MTIDGSMPASAATALMVVRSYPWAASRKRAACRIAAFVRSERFPPDSSTVMPTTVGHQLLTFQGVTSHHVYKRWPTLVGTWIRESDMTPTTALPTSTE